MSAVAALPITSVMYGSLDWLVTYEYQPAERETRTDPGCAAHIEIVGIFSPGGAVDLRDFFDESIVKEMEQKLLRQLEES